MDGQIENCNRKRKSRHRPTCIWKCAEGRRLHYKSVRQGRLFPSTGETVYSCGKNKIRLLFHAIYQQFLTIF